MCNTPLVAAYVSTARCSRVPVPLSELDSKLFDRVLFEFEDLLFQQCGNARVMDMHDALATADLSKDPGYPWNLVYGTKRDMIDALPEEFNQWWIDAASRVLDSVIQTSLKKEMRSAKKVDQQQIRTIFAVCIRHFVLLARLQRDVMNKVAVDPYNLMTMLFAPIYNGGMNTHAAYCGKFQRGWSFDVKAKDASITERFLRSYHEMMFRMLRPEDRTPDNWMRTQVAIQILIHSPLMLSDGSMWLHDAFNPSGQFATTGDNTWDTIVKLIFCFAKLAPPDIRERFGGHKMNQDDEKIVHVFKELVRCIVLGDDGKVTAAPETLEWYSFDAVARQMWDSFGDILEAPLENHNGSTSPWYQLPFLSFVCTYDEEYQSWGAWVDTSRVGSSIIHGGNKGTLSNPMLEDCRIYQRLCSIRNAAWCNTEVRKPLESLIRKFAESRDVLYSGMDDWRRAKTSLLSDATLAKLWYSLESSSSEAKSVVGDAFLQLFGPIPTSRPPGERFCEGIDTPQSLITPMSKQNGMPAKHPKGKGKAQPARPFTKSQPKRPAKKPKKRLFDEGTKRERREFQEYKSAAVQAVAKQHGIAKPIAAAMLAAGYPVQRLISKTTDAIVGRDKWNTTKNSRPRRASIAASSKPTQLKFKPSGERKVSGSLTAALKAPNAIHQAQRRSLGGMPYEWTNRASASKKAWAMNAATLGSNVGPGEYGQRPSLVTVGTGVKREKHVAYREVHDSRGRRHIVGKDFLDMVTVLTSTAEGTLIYQFVCNPRAIDASLLRGESGFYENWEGSWTAHISMTSGSGVTGSVGAYFEVDATDKRPRTVHDIRQQCFTHGGHITTLWEDSEWHLEGAPNKMYYVDIGIEPRESIQGIWNFFLDTTASATTKIDIWISYDITLHNSKFDEDSIVPGSAGYFPNTIATDSIFAVADFNPDVPTSQWDEGQVDVNWVAVDKVTVAWSVSNWWCISWVMRTATSLTCAGSVLPNTWGTCPFTFSACTDDGTLPVALTSGNGVYGGASLGSGTAFIGGWAVVYRPAALAVKSRLLIEFDTTVVGAATANNSWVLFQPMCAQDTTVAKQVGSIYPFSQDSVCGALSGVKVLDTKTDSAPLPQAGDKSESDSSDDTTDEEETENDDGSRTRERKRRKRRSLDEISSPDVKEDIERGRKSRTLARRRRGESISHLAKFSPAGFSSPDQHLKREHVEMLRTEQGREQLIRLLASAEADREQSRTREQRKHEVKQLVDGMSSVAETKGDSKRDDSDGEKSMTKLAQSAETPKRASSLKGNRPKDPEQVWVRISADEARTMDSLGLSLGGESSQPERLPKSF